MAELKAPPAIEGGHWYTAAGEAAYDVEKADGAGRRPTTLRDAKKLGLIPSVTTILATLDKPQLTLWKQKQAVRAAAATPRAEGEEEDAWVDRVIDKAGEPAAEAADLGGRIHSAIESACQGAEWDSKALGSYVAPVLAWLLAKLAAGGRIVAQEAVLVNRAEGYAGRVDAAIETADGTIWVLDWKSRKTRPSESDRAAFAPYAAQQMQLAAYAAEWAVVQGRGWTKVRCANVITSSTEPGRFAVAEHSGLEDAWNAFRATAAIWRWAKGYDPRTAPAAPAAVAATAAPKGGQA